MKAIILKSPATTHSPPAYKFDCPLCAHQEYWNYDGLFVKREVTRHLIDYHKVDWHLIKLKTKRH